MHAIHRTRIHKGCSLYVHRHYMKSTTVARGPKGPITCTRVPVLWDLASFLSSVVQFRSAISEEKSKNSESIRGQGGHRIFQIGPNNTNLVEDVEFFLHVTFYWFLFSGFRREVDNGSSNHRPGRQSCLSDRLEKQTISPELVLSSDFWISNTPRYFSFAW